MIWSRVSRHTVCLFPMVLLLERQGEGWREVKWAEKEREKRNKGDAHTSKRCLPLALSCPVLLSSLFTLPSRLLHTLNTQSLQCVLPPFTLHCSSSIILLAWPGLAFLAQASLNSSRRLSPFPFITYMYMYVLHEQRSIISLLAQRSSRLSPLTLSTFGS